MTDPARVPEAPGAAPSRLDRAVRAEMRESPGTLTFRDLIRKNKRDSALLLVAMLALAGVVGGTIAASILLGTGAEPRDLLPSVILGALAAIVVGGLASVWSWYGGASAILSMCGAVPITPDDDPQLYNVVDEMRIAAGLPMPRVYLINDSALNAFATGRDPGHAAVAVTKGLRDRLSRDQLQAVVAHEMAHVRHLDIRFAMLMATMAGLIVFACDAFLRVTWRSGGAFRASGRSKRGEAGAAFVVILVIALVLAVVAPLVARLIQMAYSRQREYLADAGAVELTRNPEALASALATLANDDDPLVDAANRGIAHMFVVNPLRKMRATHQHWDSPFSSHPPIHKRIARILALTR